MNYHIIGGDGEEYGPVAEKTIREWIADHRLDAHSKIKAEGAETWSTLAELREFADPLAAPPAPHGAPRGAVDLGVCMSSAFELFGKHWPRLVAACFIWILAILVVAVVSSVLNAPASMAFQRGAQQVDPGTLAWALPLYLAGMLLNTVLNALLWAGALRFLINVVRGAEPDFNDLFAAFQRRQMPVMLTGLAQTFLVLMVLVVGIGPAFALAMRAANPEYVKLAAALAGALPGIYLAVSYVFATPIALEQNLGVWQTLELGRRTVTRQWWPMFALLLIGAVLTLAGLCLCLVGVLAAYPIAGLMLARAYHDLFDRPADSTGRTPAS